MCSFLDLFGLAREGFETKSAYCILIESYNKKELNFKTLNFHLKLLFF